MAPLAGRPPYATDQPDSYYESAPQPRTVRVPQADPNRRTSAYDVYDNYLSDAGPLPSKHAALAAATGARDESPPPQYIAAPRPGYAAPIDALTFSRPEVAASPSGRHQAHDPDWHPNNPFNNPPPQSPMMPSTPHPLQPPMTPITPVFARPQRADSASPDVKFANEKPPIRGDGEDTLLPRRGERGDDFWRRFSMVVKEENTKKGPKESKWLSKTEVGYKRLSTWVWIVGALLVIAAAGGIGLGWYISRTSPDHERPTAIGGADNEVAVDPSPTVSPGVKTSLHVSPTNTVDRRAAEPVVTSIPRHHARRNGKRRALDLD